MKMTTEGIRPRKSFYPILIAIVLIMAVGASLWCIGAGTAAGAYRDTATPNNGAVNVVPVGYEPTIVVSDPPDGAIVGPDTSTISGNITAFSVSSAEMSIKRDSGSETKYWNGSSWQDAEAWVACVVSGSSPNFIFSYGTAGLFTYPHVYTVTAQFTDGAGVVWTSAPVTYYTEYTGGPAPGVPGISLWGGITLALLLAVLIVWLLRRRSLQTGETH